MQNNNKKTFSATTVKDNLYPVISTKKIKYKPIFNSQLLNSAYKVKFFKSRKPFFNL